jgi:dsRNA-specific ribonuclease
MEVGSSAGYYTSKSPQMILHEWCRRQNRPKPRYKVLPGEDGQFRCKVRGTAEAQHA